MRNTFPGALSSPAATMDRRSVASTVSFITLVAFFLSWVSWREVQAQTEVIHSRGHIELFATGRDATLNPNPLNAPVHRDVTGGFTLSDSASVTSYGWTSSTGLAAFASSARLATDHGELGAVVEGSGQGWWSFAPAGGGNASVSWSDTVFLNWAGTGDPPPLPDTHLVFHFLLEGDLALATSNGGEAAVTARFRTGTEIAEPLTHRLSFSAAGADQKGIRTTYDAAVSISALRSVGYNYGLDVVAWSRDGFAVANFPNGMRLDSISFLDGTTPESHGWQLAFESGLPSPNVPDEPTPVELLIELAADVDAINANNGIVNSLDAKVDNALDAFLAANAEDRQDAVHKLEAFVLSVEAQRGKVISGEEADYLTGAAGKIIEKVKE